MIEEPSPFDDLPLLERASLELQTSDGDFKSPKM